MSFHGGFLGVVIAAPSFSRPTDPTVLRLPDAERPPTLALLLWRVFAVARRRRIGPFNHGSLSLMMVAAGLTLVATARHLSETEA